MGHIRTRKHVRNCPCPRKPPIPRTGGPLHIRPWTVSDFPHLRRQFLLREPKPPPPRYAEYFGSKCTDITETQRHLVPLHALHPNLINQPDPYHNRKVTDATEYIAHMGKPRTGPLITTEEVPFHGNKATSITEYLRYVPPAHLGKNGQDAVLPHYGIRATDATGCFDERAEPTILTYMLPHRPKTAPTVVFPQHVNPAVLVNAIAERRRMFLEKPPPPSMPNSARAPERSAPMDEAVTVTRCDTARSDAGVSYGDTTARPKTATSFPAAPMSARLPESSCPTPRSDRAAPATSTVRPKTASDAQTVRTKTAVPGDQTPRSARSATATDFKTATATDFKGAVAPAPTMASGVQTPRSPASCANTARSNAASSKCSRGTPASASSTPRCIEPSKQKPCAAELLSKAAEKLGPDRIQRITNWKGFFAEPKPRMAWRC